MWAGILEQFRVNISPRQESVLTPLLFIAVVGVIRRKTSTGDILCKLLQADDLAVVADTEADLQESFAESKSGEDGGALGRTAEKRCRYKTGWEETEPARQLCKPVYSSLRGWRHGDGGNAWRKVEGRSDGT